MRYLFDTTTCSYLQRNYPSVIEKLATLPEDSIIYTSVITKGELLYGAERASKGRRASLFNSILGMLEDFAELIEITSEVAERYSKVKSELASKGNLIPDNDLWIASVALEGGYILVAHDQHFQHVDELRWEDWVE